MRPADVSERKQHSWSAQVKCGELSVLCVWLVYSKSEHARFAVRLLSEATYDLSTIHGLPNGF